MGIPKAAILSALIALAASPLAAQSDEQSGRALTTKDNFMGRNAEGSSEGAAVYDARRTSPRKRTLQAGGTAVAAAIIAATVASELRGRRGGR